MIFEHLQIFSFPIRFNVTEKIIEIDNEYRISRIQIIFSIERSFTWYFQNNDWFRIDGELMV